MLTFFVSVCVSVYVCMGEYVVCVSECVWERERERMFSCVGERKKERERVCVFVRLCVCVFVCVCLSVSVGE